MSFSALREDALGALAYHHSYLRYGSIFLTNNCDKTWLQKIVFVKEISYTYNYDIILI